jgi:hypothetical protein
MATSPIPLSASSEGQPEDEAVLADSVRLALLVVLDTLTPAERLAFVRTAGVTLRKCFRRPEAGIKHQTSQALRFSMSLRRHNGNAVS